MVNHANRSCRPDAPGRNPTPDEIRMGRFAAGLTQTAAGALIYSSCRAWQQWEAGDRRMHPSAWELFVLKTKIRDTI